MRELPPILRGDALQQIAALRDYLVRTAGNSAPGSREAASVQTADARRKRETGAGAEAPLGKESGAADALQQAGRLRSLIAKTAEESRSRDAVLTEDIGNLAYEMRQSYLARSEFGTYQREILLLIEATARQIVESYGFLEMIRATEAELGEMGREMADYALEISGQIRRGFLEDPDTHQTVLGIAISQQLQFTGQELTDGGWVYYELSPGQTLGLYTSTGWQFWVNGRKVGWFDSADGMLHTVSQAVEEKLGIGDWVISAHQGFGLKLLGG